MVTITAPNIDRCIGCKLCVLFSSLSQTQEFGLNNAFVTLSRNNGDYKFVIDPGAEVKEKDVRKIVELCPRNCLEIAV